MTLLLRTPRWVWPMLLVATCATLAARAANDVLEVFLQRLDPGTGAPRLMGARKPAPAPAAPDKDGSALAARNMFCSTCAIGSGPPPPPGGPLPTALPLELIATNVAGDDRHSFATIRHRATMTVGAYRTGQEIPAIGTVEKIRGSFVDVRIAERVERLSFSTAPVVAPKPGPAPAEDRRIERLADNRYAVDRAFVEQVLADPRALRARVVPVPGGGFKLYAIRPDSPLARIGLMNGDRIEAVNDFELKTPDQVLEVIGKVRGASHLQLSIIRRGQPIEIDYTLR